MFDTIQNFFLLVGPLSVFVQIGLCVHVYRTGRPYWWIWIILMAPVIGSLLYVLLEIIPDAHHGDPGIIKASWFTPRSVIIRRARALLEAQDTVRNRLDLATLLHNSGRKEEAEQIVADCASGVFSDDPEVISEVAWHKVEVGKCAEASILISQANTRNNKLARGRLEILKARVLMCDGHYADALSALTALQGANLGEEPRYYKALCLLGLGQPREATALLNDITKRYRKAGKLWRRSEEAWYKASTLKLKEMRKSSPPR